MQSQQGDFIWVHAVLQVRDGQDANQQPVIVCTNQVLRLVCFMLFKQYYYMCFDQTVYFFLVQFALYYQITNKNAELMI